MAKKCVLLVDDDALMRDVIKIALGREQYDVLEASDYSEAVGQLNKPVDLALIDYVLPERDGLDVLKAIRQAKPELPVILMTAYGNEDLVMKAAKSGAADYIKKPFTPANLTRKLSEILGTTSANGHCESVKTREEFIIDGMRLYIDEHCMEDLTLEKLAEMAGMNRFKFSRCFKERCGQCFTSYLNSTRVKRAAELLKNPYLTITEIAYFVGYNSVVHFERVFKELKGISPREYRKHPKQQE